MELKLNIYDDTMDTIVKTYITETFLLKLGVVEDLLQLIDLDNINTLDNTAIATAVMKRLPKVFPSLKELLKCVFKGLTDDELRNVAVTDLVKLIVGILKYSISEMSLLKTEKK